MGFEIGDQAGDHWGRHVEGAGRRGKALAVDHTAEDLHAEQTVHGASVGWGGLGFRRPCPWATVGGMGAALVSGPEPGGTRGRSLERSPDQKNSFPGNWPFQKWQQKTI